MSKLGIGMKFRVHWIGHESCYEGRVYEVTDLIRYCTCPKPSLMWDKEQVPRKEHTHIVADIVECPFDILYKRGFGFCICEDTLTDPSDPTSSIEIIKTPGVQLSFF